MTRSKYTTLFTFALLPLLIGLACETTAPTDITTATPTPPVPSPSPTMLASTAIPDDGYRPTPTPPTPTMKACTVTSLALNVRSGPGLEYPAIDWLYTGDQATITGQSGDWLHIASGWIKSNFCK